jgi:hypothetical protein
VWVFRFGDPGGLWGHPPGLWEVKERSRITSAALERCTGDDGTRIVLREGHFETIPHSYPRSFERVLQGAARWPADVCREIGIGRPEYLETTTIVEHGHMPVLRGNGQFLGLCASQAGSRFRVLSDTKLHRDLWNIGMVDAPITAFLDDGFRPTIRWLPEMVKGSYRADPFGLERDGRLHILFEEFDYHRPVGTLGAMEVADGRFGRTSRVTIGEKTHLSYPYLVEHRGDVYCIPETSLRKEVALFRATEFPKRWERVATLVEGVAAVDTTLFRHLGRWWLTFTDAAEGSALRLFVMQSTSLTSGWTPHPGNPVKTDVRSVRPAGTPFTHRGELYRPAQDCSATYGGRVALNHVLKLTPTAFEEETVGYVGPFPGEPYPQGCHTLTSVGDRTLLDGKRIVFGRPAPDVNP